MKILEQIIAVNRVYCKKCKDTPISHHGHDFTSCKCGAIAVDGGPNYLRRVGDLNCYIEFSEYDYRERIVDESITGTMYRDMADRGEIKILED